MSRSELKKTISDLRAALGEALSARQVDLVPLPCSELVLRKTTSETKKTISLKVLLAAFESVFESHEGAGVDSVMQLSSVIQQKLRDSITTVRHYGDVVEGTSAAAKRKPRGVAELTHGVFGPNDIQTVELCRGLVGAKQQLLGLSPAVSKKTQAVCGQPPCEPDTAFVSASPPPAQDSCGQPEGVVTRSGATVGHGVVQDDAPKKSPTKPERRRRSFKWSEACNLIETICATLGLERVPAWSGAAERIQAMIVAELG